MNRNGLKQRAMTAALAIALAGAAGAARAAESGQLADPEFRRLDSNRDGYLSREESRKSWKTRASSGARLKSPPPCTASSS